MRSAIQRTGAVRRGLYRVTESSRPPGSGTVPGVLIQAPDPRRQVEFYQVAPHTHSARPEQCTPVSADSAELIRLRFATDRSLTVRGTGSQGGSSSARDRNHARAHQARAAEDRGHLVSAARRGPDTPVHRQHERIVVHVDDPAVRGGGCRPRPGFQRRYRGTAGWPSESCLNANRKISVCRTRA